MKRPAALHIAGDVFLIAVWSGLSALALFAVMLIAGGAHG